MGMLLEAALFSFTLAVPVGCGSVQMLKNGTNHGSFHCFLTGTGMNAIDIVMMLLYYFGLSYIFSFDIVKIILYFVGMFIISKIGINCIKGAKKQIDIGKDECIRSPKESLKDGIKIALVPSSIIYWVSIYGVFLSKTLHDTSLFITTCIGILIGFFFNNIFYMFVSHIINKFANQKIVYFINIGSGTFLIGFSIYFAYQLFQIIFG